MPQHPFHDAQRTSYSTLLSLTHPNKELFMRHRALLRHAVPAGLPASVNNQVYCHLDSDPLFIQYKDSTIFMRISGDLMHDLNIFDGDLLVVDRSDPAANGCIVIALLNGEFIVKQLLYTAQGQLLRAGHPDYPDMLIKPEHDFSIWGIVQWKAHKM